MNSPSNSPLGGHLEADDRTLVRTYCADNPRLSAGALSAATLAWSPCGPVPRAARAETVGSAVLLTLPGQPACRLDGQPVSHLRVLPRAGNACEMELSLYESAAQLAQQQRLAWGVYRRAGCQGAER